MIVVAGTGSQGASIPIRGVYLHGVEDSLACHWGAAPRSAAWRWSGCRDQGRLPSQCRIPAARWWPRRSKAPMN